MQLREDDPEADWTVPGAHDVGAGLYRIPLPLPQDGLRAVNVYAVRDGDGLVLVDSGVGDRRGARPAGAGGQAARRQPRAASAGSWSRTYTATTTRWPSRVRREFGTRISLGRGEACTLRVVQDPAPDAVGPAAQPAAPGRRGRPGPRGTPEGGAPARYADWADPDDWLDAPAEIALEPRTLAGAPHSRAHPRARRVRRPGPGRDVRRATTCCRGSPRRSGSSSTSPSCPLHDYLGSLKLVRGLPDRRLLPGARPGRAERARPGRRADRSPRHPAGTRLTRRSTRARTRPRKPPAGCCGRGGGNVR